MNFTSPNKLTIDRFVHPLCHEDIKHDVDMFDANEHMLVAELCVKFGLQVYHSECKSVNKFYLCFPNGIPVGHAYVTTEDDKKKFFFYSPLHKKSRGTDAEDKHLYRSERLSYLMSVCQKNKLFGPEEHKHWLKGYIANILNSGLSHVYDKAMIKPTEPSGSMRFTIPEMKALLDYIEAAQNGKASMTLPVPALKFTTARSFYSQQVLFEESKKTERDKFNQCTAVIANGDIDHLLLVDVSEINSIAPLGRSDDKQIDIDNIRRIPLSQTAEHEPEINALLTMLRIAYEDRHEHKIMKGSMLVTDEYNQTLEVLHYYTRHPARYSPLCMFVAK